MDIVPSMEAVSTAIYAKFFHGLSNSSRFMIVEHLLDGEKSVNELVKLTALSQGQVSNQLACLKGCGYVSSRQEGKQVYYRVTDERIQAIMSLAKAVVADYAWRISQCTRM